MLRIAVAGAGLIGREHIRRIRQEEGLQLAAIVDPSPEAAALAGQCGVPLHGSLDEWLQQGRPDAIILATPNTLHLQQALWCIEAVIPVLVEKPVTASVAEAEQLLAVVQCTGARVLVGHHRAHSPVMRAARQVVDSGALGRLVGVTGRATFYKPDDYFAAASWRTQAGAGPILINLIHEIHSLRMLLGEVRAVQAFSSNAVRGFEVEDTVAFTLQFTSGALGTFLLSDTAASPHSWEQTTGENPAFARSLDEDCYVLTGTQGSLDIPTMRLKNYPTPQDRSWLKPFEKRTIDVANEDPLVLQLRHLAAVVRGEEAPLVSVADGLANLRVTAAVAEAARSGNTVRVNG